ncbi:hypothetical protein CONPUDRAFT_161715 [Coniophora puteana RWD-64-598 SS2]|uniref:DRBM domain-containing protein n=1 Tax=Coniophora puteana (strain RWD-64-598) TaxID=741705 RepID=A0A5M3N745_CONPW|nr:uncharacterized protein CONPUDRAFT_161715 [Coniophora puteana RWD-64-598 SS2]EIW87108.1 hypothetical protein CONPUDRAFT_161715 [Coniophora puteana RWD-64-598 SS2]
MPGGRYTTVLNNFYSSRPGHLLTQAESNSGPPHQPEWTVTFKVNGNPVGAGTAPQKNVAKERAAQAACAALGISPAGFVFCSSDMSRRGPVPLLLAAALGVISGVYIFKPSFDQAVVDHEASENLKAPAADGLKKADEPFSSTSSDAKVSPEVANAATPGQTKPS